MNSDYLKYAHDHLQTIDNGVPAYQQESHIKMAQTLAILSIADSLIHILNRLDTMIGISMGGEFVPPREEEDEEPGWDIMKPS